MKTNFLNTKSALLLLMVLFACTTNVLADIDYWTKATVVSVLKGGEATSASGLVYASSAAVESAAEIAGVAGTYTTEPEVLTGVAGSSAINKEWHYYASVLPGYDFLGFASTASGTPSGSGAVASLSQVGDYYHYTSKAGAGWSANTAETAKELKRYAVYEKQASADEEPQGTDGIAMRETQNTTIMQGAGSYVVRVYFMTDLNYRPSTNPSDHPGVNADAIRYIRVVDAENAEHTIRIEDEAVNVGHVDGANPVYAGSYATIKLPATTPVGRYNVHLPYSLFETNDGSVVGKTAACDFVVEIQADDTPISLVSSTPAEGKVWNADPESETLDGTSLTITLTFDKSIASVVEGMSADVVKQDNMHAFPCERYAKPMVQIAGADRQLCLFYGELPNGSYKVTIPAGIVLALNGQGNEAINLSFSIKGSKADEWPLPTYDQVVATPAADAHVAALRQIVLDLSGEDMDAPLGLLPTAQEVTVDSIIVTEPEEGDPEGFPTIHYKRKQDVQITPSVRNGQLILTLSPAILDTLSVRVNIPKGLTHNLAMPVGSMSQQEIYEEGCVTNPAIALNYYVEPREIAITQITNQAYTVLPDAELVVSQDLGNGQEVTCIFVCYEELLTSCVPSADFADYVTIVNESNGKVLSLNAYSCELGVLKYDEVLQQNVRDNHYINIRLSSENYINTEAAQGKYNVQILSGLGMNEDGVLTEGTSFSFTYGDPEKAKHDTELDLSEYVGYYVQTVAEGEEVDSLETFCVRENDGNYVVANLLGWEREIPIISKNGNTYLLFIEVGEEAFMNLLGGDVLVVFDHDGDKPAVFIEEFAIYTSEDMYMGGGMWYVPSQSTGCEHVEAPREVKKVIRNGQLVIRVGDTEWSVLGVQL